MWIITTSGFFSVVEKPWDVGTPFLTVRSRAHRDLNALKTKYNIKGAIKRSDDSDYMYRMHVDRITISSIICAEVMSIDYDNFKDAVKKRQGKARADIYMRVWSALLALQPFRKKKS